eukprot:scaffold77466_cov26-Tisochrysis_lutea.AAC.7
MKTLMNESNPYAGGKGKVFSSASAANTYTKDGGSAGEREARGSGRRKGLRQRRCARRQARKASEACRKKRGGARKDRGSAGQSL